MAININGDTGISGIDGSATTPAIQGTDTNTGLTFGTDTVNVVTGGSTRATVTSAGNLLFAAPTTTAEQSIQFGDPDATNRGFLNYRHSEDQLQIGAGGSTRVAVNSDGGFAFNSGFGSVGVVFGCRAWVRFDGSATTIGTGVGNGNMDAVTDNGDGDYTVNFTNDMPDANYAIVVTSADTGTSSSWTSGMKQPMLSQAAGSCRIVGHHGTDNGEARNTSNVNVLVFR